MSATDRHLTTTEERNLHAYHDGQLGAVARWWFARKLARSPALRAELAQVDRVGGWLREADLPPNPDLWDRIALHLPAIDAQRAETGTDPSELLDRTLGQPSRWTGFRPVMAAAATAAVAVAIALGTIGESPGQRPGAVRWLDTGGRSVIVLDNPDTATIVWLLDAPVEGV